MGSGSHRAKAAYPAVRNVGVIVQQRGSNRDAVDGLVGSCVHRVYGDGGASLMLQVHGIPRFSLLSRPGMYFHHILRPMTLPLLYLLWVYALVVNVL